MRELSWRAQALDELDDIVGYVAQFDRGASASLHALFEKAALPLVELPFLGRPGREPDCRELVVNPSYILVYRVLPEFIEIVSVLHTRRLYPS